VWEARERKNKNWKWIADWKWTCGEFCENNKRRLSVRKTDPKNEIGWKKYTPQCVSADWDALKDICESSMIGWTNFLENSCLKFFLIRRECRKYCAGKNDSENSRRISWKLKNFRWIIYGSETIWVPAFKPKSLCKHPKSLIRSKQNILRTEIFENAKKIEENEE
jgi:hypothetical protein